MRQETIPTKARSPIKQLFLSGPQLEDLLTHPGLEDNGSLKAIWNLAESLVATGKAYLDDQGRLWPTQK